MSETKKPVVKVNPSDEVVASAIKTIEVTDARGRVIKIKKPGPLAQYRLVEIMGDSAKNQTYMSMVLPLIYVVAIDDEQIPMPTKKMQVEALIQRLDEEGIEAVMTCVTENFGSVDPEKDKDAIKN